MRQKNCILGLAIGFIIMSMGFALSFIIGIIPSILIGIGGAIFVVFISMLISKYGIEE